MILIIIHVVVGNNKLFDQIQKLNEGNIVPLILLGFIHRVNFMAF